MGTIEDEIKALNPASERGRRGFLVGGIAGGFAASVAPGGRLLAQVISTDAAGLDAGTVQVPTGGARMPAYLARPAGTAPVPSVLVVHEAWGVHEHIQDVCRRFAKAGFLAIAPELWFRQGDPRKYQSTAEIFQNIVSKVSDAQVLGYLDACARFVPARGGDAARIGITGFCYGGRYVWLYAAHATTLKAGVAWYGRLASPASAANPVQPIDVAEKLNAPVLGLYGGKDDGIPLSTVEEMRTRLSFGTPASQASEIVVYPDAGHAFNADYRPSYRKEAALDAWQRCLAWFRSHGLA